MLGKRQPGILDRLCWDQPVEDGILRNVDGALVRTCAFTGPDLSAATAGELEDLAATFTRAFNRLGDGWLIHQDTVREPAPGYPQRGSFPDPLTRALDQERRERFSRASARFQNRSFLTLTHLPLVRGSGRAEEKHLAELKEETDAVFDLLAAQVRVSPLGTRAQLEHLYTCLTGRRQPLGLPDYPYQLESIFGAGELAAGLALQLAEQHLEVLAVVGFPREPGPAATDWLNELAFPYRASFRYLPMDLYTATRYLEGRRSAWNATTFKLRTLFAEMLRDRRDPRAAEPREASHGELMKKELDGAILHLHRHNTLAGFLTQTVVLTAERRDDLEGRAAALHRGFRNRGFVTWTERLNAAEAFFGSLPGHGYYNVRRPVVPTRAFVHLCLKTAVWPGSPASLHPKLAGEPALAVTSTQGSTSFFLNLGSAEAPDVLHTLILGPTGAGKSTLLNFLMAQWLRYPGSRVVSFDTGLSQLPLALAAGGSHYALAADASTELRLAPLAHLGTEDDRARAVSWLEELIRHQGVELDAEKRAALHRAVGLLAASPGEHTLTTLSPKIQDLSLRKALQPFLSSGPWGHLFNATRAEMPAGGRLTVFELGQLLKAPRSVVVPAAVCLFHELERMLDGTPTLVPVEEVVGLLKDSLFARQFETWLLQYRKKNAALVLVSQLLSAFLGSDLRQAVLESCPTRIFLPNRAAAEGSTAEAYEAFGLNAAQRRTLSEAVPRRQYYQVTPEGSRLFDLDLSPAALAVLGAPGADFRADHQRLAALHGDRWLKAFFEEKGHAGFWERFVQPAQEEAPCTAPARAGA